jgi:hypothetical protein
MPEQEEQELSAVLCSGMLRRAPNLERLLRYVCAKCFEGSAAQIKEYNIAVEALGRPASFDPKRDSIVRVEAHRLRKRLRQYYETEGAAHTLRIEIPTGQYAPRFVRLSAAAPEPEPGSPPPVAPATAGGKHRIYHEAALVAMLVFALWAAVVDYRNDGASRAASAAAEDSMPRAIRILAGYTRGDYTDSLGQVWLSDRYFVGGTVFDSNGGSILGTRQPGIYRSRREGTFRYNIPLAPGTYDLRLHFAETLYRGSRTGDGNKSRTFRVLVNGAEVLREFNVTAEAGFDTAAVKIIEDVYPAADGSLHLDFVPRTNPAFLNAIEIVPRRR